MTTIEERACGMLSARLAACIRQRTQLGIRKYGQRLDDNPQPERAKAVHLVQELLDGMQYAIWLEDVGLAEDLAIRAEKIARKYRLTFTEIVEGGKQ